MAMSLERAGMKFWYAYVGCQLGSSLDRHRRQAPGCLAPRLQAAGERARRRRILPSDDRVLDLGCGSGVLAVFAASKAREVVAVDISPSAVEDTVENCPHLRRTNVTVKQSDMFSNVEGKFDIVLTAPPYLSLKFESDEQQFATSDRFLPSLFSQVGDHLVDGGRLLVVFPLRFHERLEKLAAAHGLELLEVNRAPRKSLALGLLSLAYMR